MPQKICGDPEVVDGTVRQRENSYVGLASAGPSMSMSKVNLHSAFS